MKSNELDSLKNGINKLLYRRIISITAEREYQGFDFSELNINLTENSTVEEIKEYLAEITKIQEIQYKIFSDATEKLNPIIAEKYNINKKNHKIYNYGNYYIVIMTISGQNYGNPFYKNFCSVYNKEGQLLLPFDKERRII